MVITDFLERNARLYGSDTALVEVNPSEERDSAVTWREASLIAEAQPDAPYRRELSWRDFDRRAVRKKLPLPARQRRQLLAGLQEELEPFSYDFSRDAIIRVDTEGRTSGTYCGVQFGWTPTALIPDNTAYLYDVIAMRSPAQLDGISDAQMELAKDCVYSTDSTAQVRFTFSCLSANEVVGCDLLVPGDDPAIVKEGMLNDLYACWIETYDTDRGADITHHFLLLYDADKLCVVFLGGDWDITEKIAEHMTIVQTGIPTPEASQNFTYVGVFG